MNLIDFAKSELEGTNWCKDGNDDYDNRIAESVLNLIKLFASQCHSNTSAQITTELFNKLARYQILTPLTGACSEWDSPDSSGTKQNLRCSHVFMKDGEAYDIEGKVFEELSGLRYWNRDSKIPVKFPYMPKTEVVSVREGSYLPYSSNDDNM